MPTFILSLNWTDQGIRSVKDAPKATPNNYRCDFDGRLGLMVYVRQDGTDRR